MTSPRRPSRAAFRASAAVLTAALLVTTAGTPIAGGQDSGSLGTESLNPGSGGSGSLGSAGSPGSGDEYELVGPDATPLRDIDHSIIPKDDTEIAAAGTVMSVTGEIGSEQSTVINPDQDDVPEIGDYFVVEVGPGSPDGVVGRVTGVTVLPSGLVQVTTEPASIQDAYDEFTINTTVDLQDAVSTDGGTEAGPMGRMQAHSAAGLAVQPALSWLDCEGSRPDTFSTKFNWDDLSAQVVFDPLDQYLKIVLNHTLSAEFAMAFGGAVECTVPATRMPSAFIPVAGPFGIKASPTVHLQAAARANVTAESRARRWDGVEIQGMRTRGIAKADPLVSEIRADAGIDASLYVGVNAELAASIRAIEATAGISAGPEFNASWAAPDCAELSATFRVSASVSASALWLFEWSRNVLLAKIGFLSLITECGPGSSSTTTSTTSTTTTTPPPGFRDGAVTNLVVGTGLNCDVQSPTDGRSVYYGPGACATIAHVDGRSYGTSVPASGGFESGWTPVSQSIAGSATAADPMVIRTTVRAGDTGIELDQVDYFVDGNPGYQTDITVRNTSGEAKDVKIYRAADCYLSNNDYGTGSVYSRSVSCNDNSGRRIALTDLTGGALRQEADYSQIWHLARTGTDYNDTSLNTEHDNGMGINWNRTIPAGASAVLRSRFQLDEPVHQDGSEAAARVASPRSGPDVKREQPTEAARPLPTSVPTS